MYILFFSTERRTDKGALNMRCDGALANYLFFVRCSCICFSLVFICLTFDLTLFKWFAFKQLTREQC